MNTDASATAIKDLDSKSIPQTQESQKQGKQSEMNPIFVAWLYMLESVTIQNDTARVQAKNLQVNAKNQLEINSEESEINFIPINTHLSKSQLQVEIPKVQEENQEKEKIRAAYSNDLIVLRQKAQVKETNVNTSVNNTEQTQQESAAILQLLVNVTNQVLK